MGQDPIERARFHLEPGERRSEARPRQPALELDLFSLVTES
jgi:hypothetical protein